MGILFTLIGSAMFFYIPARRVNNRCSVKSILITSLSIRFLSMMAIIFLQPSFSVLLVIAGIWGLVDAAFWSAVVNDVILMAGDKNKGMTFGLLESVPDNHMEIKQGESKNKEALKGLYHVLKMPTVWLATVCLGVTIALLKIDDEHGTTNEFLIQYLLGKRDYLSASNRSTKRLQRLCNERGFVCGLRIEWLDHRYLPCD